MLCSGSWHFKESLNLTWLLSRQFICSWQGKNETRSLISHGSVSTHTKLQEHRGGSDRNGGDDRLRRHSLALNSHELRMALNSLFLLVCLFVLETGSLYIVLAILGLSM